MVRASSLPPVAVRVFEAAARLGSFKAAADELGVTPAAISHQVKALEVYLGTPLFDRLHRALRLTEVGARLASGSSEAMNAVDRALEDLEGKGLLATAATLRVSAAPTFASKWLVPRLHLYQTAHPGVALRLKADDTLTDPVLDREIDVVIRYGPGNYAPSLRSARLWPNGVIIAVCAPSTAAQLHCLDDMANVPLLRTAMPSQTGFDEPIGWKVWFEAAGVESNKVAASIKRAPRFSTSQLALEAAMAGQGVALCPRVLVTDDLASGRLVMPFPTAIPDLFAFWVLNHRDRNEPRILKFVDWLVDTASCEP